MLLKFTGNDPTLPPPEKKKIKIKYLTDIFLFLLVSYDELQSNLACFQTTCSFVAMPEAN